MEDQGDQRALADALDRFSRKADEILKSGNTATQTVRVEGMGSMWNGIAIGIALGASVACAAWVAAALGDLTDDQRNDDAFIQATYQQAPSIRSEFDRIRAEQEAKKQR